MTDPERLLAGGSAFERTLLAAALAERPSPALVARMEQGLGLSSAAASAVTVKGVVVAIATTVVGGLAAWGALGSDAGLVRAPGIQRTPSVLAAQPALLAEVAPVLPGGTARGPAPAADPLTGNEPVDPPHTVAPSSNEARVSRAAPASSVRSPVVVVDRLREEVRDLDRVRAQLSAGNRERALELLDGYDRRFPNGTLAPEARKLRQSAGSAE